MDGERHARCFDQVLLEEIEPVGPILHHPPPLLDVLGVVVGGADLVGIDVRELCVHPHLRVADLVERGGHRAPDAMPGQQVAIAHALERAVECVLAHALLQFAVVAEQIVLGRFELFQQVPDNLDGLHRQRHDVGWNVLGQLALPAHVHLELLHDLGRDDPKAPIEVELIRRRQAQLARAHAGE